MYVAQKTKIRSTPNDLWNQVFLLPDDIIACSCLTIHIGGIINQSIGIQIGSRYITSTLSGTITAYMITRMRLTHLMMRPFEKTSKLIMLWHGHVNICRHLTSQFWKALPNCNTGEGCPPFASLLWTADETIQRDCPLHWSMKYISDESTALNANTNSHCGSSSSLSANYSLMNDLVNV